MKRHEEAWKKFREIHGSVGDILRLKGILKPYFKDKKPISLAEMHETTKAYVVEQAPAGPLIPVPVRWIKAE